MKKFAALFIILVVAIFSSACSLFNQNIVESNENHDKTIILNSYNIKELDFESLYYDIVDNLYYESEEIYIPTTDIIPYEMRLNKYGEITYFRFLIFQILEEDAYNCLVQEYWIEYGSNSIWQTGHDESMEVILDARGPATKYSRTHFKNSYDLGNENYNFKQYMFWFDTFDFDYILSEIDSPYLDYIDIIRDKLELSILGNEDVQYTYLKPTDNGFVSANNLKEMEILMTEPYNDEVRGEYYDLSSMLNCIIMPFYLKVDGVTGCDEQTLGQIEKKTVVSNNVLIII